MARRAKSVASRGSVNNIILESLASGQKYGYEIIKEVEEKTNGKIKLKQPSLYSSLKRFESKGIISSYWGDSDIGGRRHYYSLTKYGIQYYNRLKSKADDLADDIDEDDTINETIEEKIDNTTPQYDIDDSRTDTEDYSVNYRNFSVEDRMKELLDEDVYDEKDLLEDLSEFNSTQDNINQEELFVDNPTEDKNELLDQLYNEKEDEPEEYDLNEEQEEIIPDHTFYKPVPLSEYKNEKYEESYIKLYGHDEINNEQIEEQEEIVKQSTEIKEEIINQDTFIPQPKKPRIVTDELGITKLVYDDEDTKRKTSSVIDNVVIRSNPVNLNNDLARLHNKQNIKQHNILDNMTDAEREERNQKFVKKFHDITSERMTSPTTPENTEYKERLNKLFDENENTEETMLQDDMDDAIYLKQEQKEEIDKKMITKKFNEIIDDESINVKVYSQSAKSTSDNKYLLINKAKFAFGLVMLVLMLLQLTVSMIILKNNGTLYKDKLWAFECGYVVVALVCLYYCIPVFISPNKQSTSPYKLSYAIMFGLLAFFISLILIYTINTFMGLDFENVKYFAPTLVAPIVLATNFILGPIIYKVITTNKRFY